MRNLIFYRENILPGKCLEKIVKIDDRGRILIPIELRQRLGLKCGSRLKIMVYKGRIILEPMIPRIKKVKANRRWREEAFLDAGEATFG